MKKSPAVIAAGIILGMLSLGLCAPSYAATTSDQIAQILKDTNAIRADNGLDPLVLNPSVSAVAQAWSTKQALADGMSHNPDYASQLPKGWLRAGENVAAGYTYDKVVTTGWAKSAGHLANILGDYTDIGIGIATAADGTVYYTQNFVKYPGSTYVAIDSDDFTVRTHVQTLGWIDGGGTTGRGLRVEAMMVTQTQSSTTICARAHVQNIGWQAAQCTSGVGTSITVGTTGRALRMEALQLWSPQIAVRAQAHVQNIGWQAVQTASGAGAKIIVGTTGKALRVEALRLLD
ncbi:CAP domain-containing protein [Microbacterium sp.]|uniref:CAP domain-containing protein n=1 Tax=Microbacterium sp. TaxID=51671 RepID=UPI0039E60EBF